MKYGIVKRQSLEALVKHLNALLADGWRPQGGVCRDSDRDGATAYCQAVILDGEPDIEAARGATTTTTATADPIDPLCVVRWEGFWQ